jgi:ankyrin repeat protein
MAGIFISYRREDTAGYAGRLYDQLSAHFGDERVFMDVSDIEPGEDFAKAIETTVHTCDAAVVLIGKNWLSKRLEDPGDFVLLEITSALQRSIPVIPVLVDDTRMPAAAELPQSLAPLCRRQAVELTNSMFREDVNRLIQSLDRVCHRQKRIAVPAAESLHAADQAKSRAKWMRLAAILVVLTSVVALFSFITHRSTHEKNIENQPDRSASAAAAFNSHQPPSALITAIQQGRLDAARNLITNGAKVNAANVDGTTALMQAAEGSVYMPNNEPAVAMLLDSGAKVDAQDNRGRTALYRAAAEGKTEAMRLLLARKANPNQQAIDGSSPLLAAITFGRVEAVNLLLASGSDVNLPDAQRTTPLALAAEGTAYMPNNAPLVRILLEKGAKPEVEDARGRTPLHRAAAEGKNEAVELLLNNKANPNVKSSTGATPLLEAVTYGRQPTVELLLQRGADVNLADAQGNTALMIAAEGTAYFPNNAPMTDTILDAKANVKAQDSRGRSSLYRASAEGKIQAMTLLLDKGANPNLQANDGSTALLQTVTYGRLGAATLLLSRGANVDLPDASGNTPLMVAAEGNPFIKSTADLITLLLAHKAQLTVVDNRGRSALARATESKNTAAIEILSKK